MINISSVCLKISVSRPFSLTLCSIVSLVTMVAGGLVAFAGLPFTRLRLPDTPPPFFAACPPPAATWATEGEEADVFCFSVATAFISLPFALRSLVLLPVLPAGPLLALLPAPPLLEFAFEDPAAAVEARTGTGPLLLVLCSS